MKFKQQEEPQEQPQERNKFLPFVGDLLSLNREFQYAITSYKFGRDELDLCEPIHLLDWDFDELLNLYVALDKSHSHPFFSVDNKAVSDLKELVKLEERYYESLKELGSLGLKDSNIEVVAHISNAIVRFKHTFCKLLNESDSTL